VKDSKPGEGPCINVGVDKNVNNHGQYFPIGNKIMFHRKAFLNDSRTLYTTGHELGHWARTAYAQDVWIGLKSYSLLNPDPGDEEYGYGAERAIFGGIMYPNGTLLKY